MTETSIANIRPESYEKDIQINLVLEYETFLSKNPNIKILKETKIPDHLLEVENLINLCITNLIKRTEHIYTCDEYGCYIVYYLPKIYKKYKLTEEELTRIYSNTGMNKEIYDVTNHIFKNDIIGILIKIPKYLGNNKSNLCLLLLTFKRNIPLSLNGKEKLINYFRNRQYVLIVCDFREELSQQELENMIGDVYENKKIYNRISGFICDLFKQV